MIVLIKYNSPVILSYTIIAFFVVLLDMFIGDNVTYMLFMTYRKPITDPLMYIRLFGHVLGHVDFYHYYNNFLIILLVGPMLEEKYGSKNLVIMILITAFITGLLNNALFNTALLGASGIVFMFICLSSFVNFTRGRIPLTFIFIVVIFMSNEFANSMISNNSNISHITHITGGVCGSFLGFFMRKSR